jgi:hypothetical protein
MFLFYLILLGISSIKLSPKRKLAKESHESDVGLMSTGCALCEGSYFVAYHGGLWLILAPKIK